jgi:hypothetical protein
MPWRRGLVESSPPAIEETGAMVREIESRQDICKGGSLKNTHVFLIYIFGLFILPWRHGIVVNQPPTRDEDLGFEYFLGVHRFIDLKSIALVLLFAEKITNEKLMF